LTFRRTTPLKQNGAIPLTANAAVQKGKT
jgi:hypothetical protein